MASKEEVLLKINDFLAAAQPLQLGLANQVAERLHQKITFLESLNGSIEPLKKIIEETYNIILFELRDYADMLRLNPAIIGNILHAKTLEGEQYDIMSKVADVLLMQEMQEHESQLRIPFHHAPSYVLHSLFSIRQALSQGKPDIGIAVGPEGFAYGCLFGLYGFPVKNIHIDEYCTTEDRPYKELDDLSEISGKHVLLIEDDVKTGKTLQKAVTNVRRHNPSVMSLYLGSPEKFQEMRCIPQVFQQIFVTPNYLEPTKVWAEIDHIIARLERKYPIVSK